MLGGGPHPFKGAVNVGLTEWVARATIRPRQKSRVMGKTPGADGVRFSPRRSRGGNRYCGHEHEARSNYEWPNGSSQDSCSTNRHAAHVLYLVLDFVDQPRLFADNLHPDPDTTAK